MERKVYDEYRRILEKELVPAMGCTEPIAMAYCGAVARSFMKEAPKAVVVYASGNLVKNVKSVIVPHTGGLRGIETAVAAGLLYGKADRVLEVIAGVTEEEQKALPAEMAKLEIKVKPLISEHVLDLVIEVSGETEQVMVHIQDEHTRIVEITYNGQAVDSPLIAKGQLTADPDAPDYSLLNVEDIVYYADTVDLDEVRETLDRQITCNMAIAEAGLSQSYGANIGKVILQHDVNIQSRAKAYAAAGSDARMNGCDMPVVINSGSGNQGLTASLPVVIYAQYYRKKKDELLRALLVSNLVTIHLKDGIGRLSAYCGAVSAGAGAGAGIGYLLTQDEKVVRHTIVNAIAITSGIVCDGAKSSCAAKIAMAIEAGILGFEMYEAGDEFVAGDGLVSKGVENTIRNISALGHDGMAETDKKIIELMTK